MCSCECALDGKPGSCGYSDPRKAVGGGPVAHESGAPRSEFEVHALTDEFDLGLLSVELLGVTDIADHAYDNGRGNFVTHCCFAER